MRSEDYEQNRTPSGDVFDSPAEHVIKALGHLAKLEMPENQVIFAKEFIEMNYERYPGQKWFPYYLSLYMNRTGEQEKALELLIPIAREKSSEFWAWQHVADCFGSGNEKRLACLCRAVRCHVKEEVFLINVRISLAEELLAAGQKEVAKHHLALVKALREKNGWPIKDRLEELINQSWFGEAEAASGEELIKDYARKADQILLEDLPRYEAVIGSPPFQIGKKNHTFSAVDYLNENNELKSTLANHHKFDLIRDLSVGDPLEIMVDDSGEKPMVIAVNQREGEKFDILPLMVGMVSHVNLDKSLSMVKLEDGNKAIMFHNEVPDSDKLIESTFVHCKIAQDRDRLKVRSFELTSDVGDSDYWKSFTGNFRAKDQGNGGHVDSLFIPGHLAAEISDGDFVRGMAVLRSGDNGRDWWCAVSISEIQKNDGNDSIEHNSNTPEVFVG
ncbi:MAG: hypothetical protein HON27_13995 [Candidatus Marinimicrobia bacterium]|nr:hypothetical protein [Candidatus Neomarinimicrobiota bacterium]MBT6010984.1 hypothetical protein [Candidatus Neomarinimicrobiota bacterium]